MSKMGERIAKRVKDDISFEVEAWGEGDDSLTIYHGPFTAGEMNRIQRKHPGFLGNPTLEAFVDIIILKAKEKGGEAMFDLKDKVILLREEVGVISMVANSLMSGESQEELEKN